jgi:adenylosuccinate lyase
MSEPQFSHDTYLSPFTWRYGSAAMRALWSEAEQRRLWRALWVALAKAQQAAGLVTAAQVQDLHAHQNDIDLARAHAIEAEIKHDLMAEVKCYAEQCPIGGGIIHLGATSMDIEDNATALRLRAGLDYLTDHLRKTLATLATLIEAHADTVCIAFTHLQPAALTTVGYRLAFYGQDLHEGWLHLQTLRATLRGKGFKGAVGTAATYALLLEDTPLDAASFEGQIMAQFGLPAYLVANQTYPRRQDWLVLQGLADLALSFYKFAFDLRVLQSPPIGEWAEPFGAAQVGSSAMPFKRNPINAENIDSLARYVAALPQVAWENAANNLLERTLDDSANRRAILPDAFLATEEIILRANRLLAGLHIDSAAIARNVASYGVFSATERLLMLAVKAGADRQALHEVIREHSLAAWASQQAGQPNPLADLLCADAYLAAYMPATAVRQALDAPTFVGDAPARARAMAAHIRQDLAKGAATSSG